MTTLSNLLRPVSRFALAAGLAGVVGFAAPVSVSFAQDGASAGERGERAHRGRRGHRGHHGHMRRMAQELQLTDAQREQLRALRREARDSGERVNRREAFQAILTPAQRARLAELHAERGVARIDRRVERMTERLSLSPTQAQQVGGILRNSAMQARALREQGANDPASAREAMRGLRERTQAAVRSVLNAEQVEQLEAAHARRAERRAERGDRPARGERQGRRGAR